MDDTKIHKGLRPYHDGGDNHWKLAGVHAEVPEFKTYDELRDLITSEQVNKAEKVCDINSVFTYVMLTRSISGSCMARCDPHCQHPPFPTGYHAHQVDCHS